MAKKSIPNFGGNRTMPLGMKNKIITEADIKKIKDEATAKAVEILEKKYDVDQIRRQAVLDAEAYLQEVNRNERQKIREEMYDELFDALHADMLKLYIITGCKVLNEQFGFGQIRLERFIESLAQTQIIVQDDDEEETLENMEKWLDERFGLRLVAQDGEEAIEERRKRLSEDDMGE